MNALGTGVRIISKEETARLDPTMVNRQKVIDVTRFAKIFLPRRVAVIGFGVLDAEEMSIDLVTCHPNGFSIGTFSVFNIDQNLNIARIPEELKRFSLREWGLPPENLLQLIVENRPC